MEAKSRSSALGATCLRGLLAGFVSGGEIPEEVVELVPILGGIFGNSFLIRIMRCEVSEDDDELESISVKIIKGGLNRFDSECGK